jgi:hypothetical protein
MGDDPLAAYRRERSQANNMVMPGGQAGFPSQAQEPLSEHEALKLAIEALNQIPNRSLKGEYRNTYELIPVIDKAYRGGGEPENRTQPSSNLLDASREVAERLERLAVLDEAQGYHPSAEANLEMAGSLRAAIAEAEPELKLKLKQKNPEPERGVIKEIDIEPER